MWKTQKTLMLLRKNACNSAHLTDAEAGENLGAIIGKFFKKVFHRIFHADIHKKVENLSLDLAQKLLDLIVEGGIVTDVFLHRLD